MEWFMAHRALVIVGSIALLFIIALIVRTMRAERASRRRILIALDRKLENEKMYGLDLVGLGAGKRGTIYVTLQRMDEDGLIRSDIADADVETPEFGVAPPRRHYAITEKGRAHLARL